MRLTSWTAISRPGLGGFNATGDVDSVALAPATSTIYASTGGTFASTSTIFMTTTDGAAWTERDLPVSGRINELDVDPNDPSGQTVYAVINAFNGANGVVYRTTNGGVTWANISGNLPQIPTWSLKVDTNASDTVYVSNETGVYSSTSPYTTWTLFGAGLPRAQGVDLELSSSQSPHLLGVATHGRGGWLIQIGTTAPGPPTVYIDAPAQGSAVSGTVTVSGWAVDNAAVAGSAISSVQVEVDRTVEEPRLTASPRRCLRGLSRQIRCPNVSYTYALNASGLSLGSRTITVTATDSDETPDTGSSSVTVNVQAPLPTVYIDAPAQGSAVSAR